MTVGSWEVRVRKKRWRGKSPDAIDPYYIVVGHEAIRGSASVTGTRVTTYRGKIRELIESEVTSAAAVTARQCRQVARDGTLIWLDSLHDT
jgi:hypothetical protein